MSTQCNQLRLPFQDLGRREIVLQFDAPRVSTDCGGLLLREVEHGLGIIRQFAECFTDHRDPEQIEHSTRELLAQRIFGLTLGYEDLIDHDDLRGDPLVALMVGKDDLMGDQRHSSADRGKPLAGKSTLNRLELTRAGAGPKSRYQKIVAHHSQIDDFFVETFLRILPKTGQVPEELVLDIDATDDPLHGEQLGRFFHGYYKNYCYLPLYIFCGPFPLSAKLRPSNIDACAGTVEQLMRIVPRLRRQWPDVRIVVRGDSGFCREPIMHWCEENNVDYLFGLAKNTRLKEIISEELEQAQQLYETTGKASRVYKDFEYSTLSSWTRSRRVVGKAEYLAKGANPRFVVTSLSAERVDAQTLYEQKYCSRGDMENRIKEQQLYLFADRTSTQSMRGNQLRLYFSTVAYLEMLCIRLFGLKGTPLENAQCHTIRTKLLKLGGVVRVTVRKVWIHASEHWPYRDLFERVLINLHQAIPMPLLV